MNSEAIAEYVARLLAKPDEDAFHSLIEGGDQTVEAVRSALSTCSNEQFKRQIEVLQDIRTDRSRATLAELCRGPYSEQWVMAAEGLFYNDPDSARPVLLGFLVGGDKHEQAKSAFIEELLSSIIPPTPDSPSF